MIDTDESLAKQALEIVEVIIDNAINVHTNNIQVSSSSSSSSSSSLNEHENILFKLKEGDYSNVKENIDENNNNNNKELNERLNKDTQLSLNLIKNIEWPTIEQFTIDLGILKINEFIQSTWVYDTCWLYCVDHVQTLVKEFTTLYQYRCKWSLPTRRKPIARFTASVYFTYNVSNIKPKDKTKVDVYYQLETQRSIHVPGRSYFRQEWLNDILRAKEITLNTFRF